MRASCSWHRAKKWMDASCWTDGSWVEESGRVATPCKAHRFSLPLQASVEYMQREHGLDLGQLLRQCIREHGSLLAFRGGPLTYCGSAPAGPQTALL